MPTCKGIKKDGTPCRSSIVLDNGYCRAHQDQASEDPVRWTRERLEAAIANHGGPEGLDLAGADLSNLNLSGMDLHGIILGRTGATRQQVLAEAGFASGGRIRLVITSNRARRRTSGQSNRLRASQPSLTSATSPSFAGGRDEGSGIRIATNLQGAKLWASNLERADLEGANLQGAELWASNLQGASLYDASLQEASLYDANLQEADLRGASLQEASLYDANLQGADLRGASLQGANLRFADLREVDLLDVKTGGLRGIKLYRAKLDHTVLKREQLGLAIGEEPAGKYREARDAYLALKQNFESLGDYEAASWAYIKERQMEKACSAPWLARRFYGKEQLGDTSEHRLPAYHPRVWWFFARHTAKWLGDWFVEVLCGYGESISRVLGWMAVLLFVSPLLFGLLGLLHWPKANYDAFFSLPVPWRYGYAYLQQLLYVLDAFTTADFAELQPANSLGRLLSGLIALVGIFLTGLLGFVAGNRIRRS